MDQLLHRIGLGHAPAVNAEGLREVHRAFIAAVPYETIAVQLEEARPLDASGLVGRVLDGRGGYCFEMNAVLHGLLTSLGFLVEMREGIVGARDARAQGTPTNHLTLVVQTPDGPFIADAGLGDGPIDPLALRAGATRSGLTTFRVERDPGGWWVGFDGPGHFPGFSFLDAPVGLDAFHPHHARLCAPDSPYARTLVVQQAHDDRVVTLRARTLTIDDASGRHRELLEDEAAFDAALREHFGIRLDADRRARLWQRALAPRA